MKKRVKSFDLRNDYQNKIVKTKFHIDAADSSWLASMLREIRRNHEWRLATRTEPFSVSCRVWIDFYFYTN